MQDGPLKQQFSVLLVEDDAVTLLYVEQLLKKCGYEGERASRARRGRFRAKPA